MNPITRRTLIGAAAVLATTLSACGTGSGTENDGDLGSATGAITYSYWGSPARAEKVEAVIDLFHGSHDEIAVTGEMAEYNAYMERLTVRAAGGDLACATGAQSTMIAQYATQGVLAPLGPYIDAGLIDVSALSEEVLAAGQVDGTQYMIPTGTFLRLLAYNSELIEESGASEPAEAMTWEEYADWLREVQTGLPEGVYASAQEGTNLFTLYSWVSGHGQEMFGDGGLGFDRELLAEWFEYWLALSDEGVTNPPAQIADQFGALEQSLMARGVVASATLDIPHMHVVESVLVASGSSAEVLHVSNPSNDPSQSSNVLGSNGIAIPASCDRGAAAATFIDFFLNDVGAGLAFQSDNGVVTAPAVQDALIEDPATPDGVRQNVTILREYVDAGAVTTITYPAGVGALLPELRRIFEDLAFGRTTVDDAVETFFAEADRLLG